MSVVLQVFVHKRNFFWFDQSPIPPRFYFNWIKVLLVLLDLSAAFDTVCHGILLLRLESCVGIKGAALE